MSQGGAKWPIFFAFFVTAINHRSMERGRLSLHFSAKDSAHRGGIHRISAGFFAFLMCKNHRTKSQGRERILFFCMFPMQKKHSTKSLGEGVEEGAAFLHFFSAQLSQP